MDTQKYVEKLEAKIVQEQTAWAEREVSIQQQFAMEQGAYLGRVQLLEEQIKDFLSPEESESETGLDEIVESELINE